MRTRASSRVWEASCFAEGRDLMLSRSSFVVMLLGPPSRNWLPFSRRARSCLLPAPCETIALDELFRLDTALALALLAGAVSLTGRGRRHADLRSDPQLVVCGLGVYRAEPTKPA